MLNLRDELSPGRNILEKPDLLSATEELDGSPETCPFCGKESIFVETFETMYGSEVSSRIGFFTCLSCGEAWCDLIDG